MAPERLLRSWQIRPQKDGRLLLVDLQGPLTRRDKTLPQEAYSDRPTAARWPKRTWRERIILSERLSCRGAVPRRCLAIAFDERTDQLAVKTTALEAPPDEDGPWEKDLPAHYYPYRALAGDGGPPVVGVLTIRPRPPRVRAPNVRTTWFCPRVARLWTFICDWRPSRQSRLVDLCVSAPYVPAASGDPWGWRADRGGVEVREARRMPLGRRRRPAAWCSGRLGGRGGTDRPAARRVLACDVCSATARRRAGSASCTLTAKTGEKRQDVPLTAVLGERMEGEASCASPPLTRSGSRPSAYAKLAGAFQPSSRRLGLAYLPLQRAGRGTNIGGPLQDATHGRSGGGSSPP